MTIYCSNPQAQYFSHQAEIDAAVKKVLASNQYILGDQVTRFEQEFADYIGVGYGIGVGSGTDALFLTLKALGIGVGDEVITVSHTAVASVTAIAMTGATPVLVDIESDYFTMNPQALKLAITPNTKAIIPVHLYGQPADLSPILAIAHEHKLTIIEDCAQAHGAAYHGKKVGSFGELACFSFYPTKNLGAIGDGGMIVTKNQKLAMRIKALREYGWDTDRVSQIPGYNSRLDELQAAILRVKLKYLDKDNAARQTVARYYTEKLGDRGLALPSIRAHCSHVFHQYVLRTPNRDALKKSLEAQDIFPGIHYPVPVHQQPGYKSLVRITGKLTVTETVAGEILSLPIYPELSLAQAKIIVEAVSKSC